MKKYLLILLIGSLTIVGCGNEQTSRNETINNSPEINLSNDVSDESNEKIKQESIKYAGDYALYDDYGLSEERYKLNKDLSSEWTYQGSSKYGNWFYKDDKITISINGKTGIIKQVFSKTGNKWIDVESSIRYIQKL